MLVNVGREMRRVGVRVKGRLDVGRMKLEGGWVLRVVREVERGFEGRVVVGFVRNG